MTDAGVDSIMMYPSELMYAEKWKSKLANYYHTEYQWDLMETIAIIGKLIALSWRVCRHLIISRAIP